MTVEAQNVRAHKKVRMSTLVLCTYVPLICSCENNDRTTSTTVSTIVRYQNQIIREEIRNFWCSFSLVTIGAVESLEGKREGGAVGTFTGLLEKLTFGCVPSTCSVSGKELCLFFFFCVPRTFHTQCHSNDVTRQQSTSGRVRGTR